jgi:hypothetical protein
MAAAIMMAIKKKMNPYKTLMAGLPEMPYITNANIKPVPKTTKKISNAKEFIFLILFPSLINVKLHGLLCYLVLKLRIYENFCLSLNFN